MKNKSIEEKSKKQVLDFNYINLPHTRKELFFDIVKQRWRTLYGVGLIFFLTCIPLFILIFFKDSIAFSISINPDIADAEKLMTIYRYNLIFCGFICLSLLIVAIFLGGILKNVRNLSYEEPIFLKEDFFSGIKDSWSSLLLSFFIYSLILFAILIGCSHPALSPIIKGVLIAILILILTPIHLIVICETYVYTNSFLNYVYNALLIYIKFFFWMLLIGIIFALPALSIFIPNYLIKFIVLIFYFIFIFPLVMLFIVILMNYLFDKGINEKNYPEIANKGLYKEKKNEDKTN